MLKSDEQVLILLLFLSVASWCCRYGHHVSNNSYFLCYDPPTIKKMFDRLRDYEGSGTVSNGALSLAPIDKSHNKWVLLAACRELVED